MMWQLEAGARSTESTSVAGIRGYGSDSAIGSTTGRRKPLGRVKEHNMRREQRRRAVATKIFGGLRARGNYNLPMNCDSNIVLKALCNEAGWIVEPDGTTYRKESKPVPLEIGGTSTPSSSRNPTQFPPPSCFPTPITSYLPTPTPCRPPSCFPTPITSYLPTPLSSACPNPTRFNDSVRLPNPYTYLRNAIYPNLPPLPNAEEPRPRFSLNFPTFNTVSSVPTSRPARVPCLTPPSPIPECDEADTLTKITAALWKNNFGTFLRNDAAPTTSNLVKPAAGDHWVPFGGDPDVGKGKSQEFGFHNAAGNPWKGKRKAHDAGMEEDDDLELELTLGSKNARL